MASAYIISTVPRGSIAKLRTERLELSPRSRARLSLKKLTYTVRAVVNLCQSVDVSVGTSISI
jgi:hypothetical protein